MSDGNPAQAVTISRRQLLLASAIATVSAPSALSEDKASDIAQSRSAPFRYCFNTSTIRGQKLDIVRQVEVTAKAGYSGIEPWVRDIEAYLNAGGSLRDLRKRIADAGLNVESAIAFPQWIVDDEPQRAKGLEDARRQMGLLREIGGTRIAAPPAGATQAPMTDLATVAARFGELLKVGQAEGVTPQLELWGFSKTLSRLGEMAFVAAESGQETACVLPDVYHIYKGGSDFSGLRMFAGTVMHCFHINDYPADPPRETINDSDRVFPGDGVAPLDDILRTLYRNGFRGALSLELFNPRYWEQDALDVATTGLRKTQEAVARALNL